MVALQSLHNRIASKLKGWKQKLLSYAGRDVLIKSVISFIPTYFMSCYKLPKGCCDEINAMIARFWWGQNVEERRIHWVRWDKLVDLKNTRGLGFKDMQDLNVALLTKMAWRLFRNLLLSGLKS